MNYKRAESFKKFKVEESSVNTLETSRKYAKTRSAAVLSYKSRVITRDFSRIYAKASGGHVNMLVTSRTYAAWAEENNSYTHACGIMG